MRIPMRLSRAVALLVAALAGCGPSSSRDGQPPAESRSPSSVTTVQAEIELTSGVEEAAATFIAPDPRVHSQSIRVEIRPSSGLDLVFVTADAATLHLLEADDISDCPRHGDASVCEILLPILEAREPGEWQAIARRAAATDEVVVLIEITWVPEDG